MCTYAFHFDPSAQWPFVIAGNRDEMTARPWSAPAGHWPDRPGVIAGLDQTAGGSWAGMNDDGVIACILNRWDTLGPAAGKRSRGEIVLDALDFADAADAADALSALAPEAYRGFNLVVADNRDCFWLRCVEGKNVEVHTVSAGTHLISHGDLDDLSARRIERYFPKFQILGAPKNPDDPSAWDEWRALLDDRSLDPSDDPKSALRIDLPDVGFGTSSQSFMAVRAMSARQQGLSAAVYWFRGMDQGLARVL